MRLDLWAAEVKEIVDQCGSLREAAKWCTNQGFRISHNTLSDWQEQRSKSIKDVYVEGMARLKNRDPEEFRAYLNGREYVPPPPSQSGSLKELAEWLTAKRLVEMAVFWDTDKLGELSVALAGEILDRAIRADLASQADISNSLKK